MQQIVSITDARNNLSQLVDQVNSNSQPVVIVRDSKPEAAIVSYAQLSIQTQKDDELWNLKWDKLIKAGKKAGQTWAKDNGVDLKTMTEEKLYDLIDKV
ncbi:MAG: type II toxin-antitoxin system Phd/YefM family antitoxin [Patescibacteria group bacterium]